jgi:hypothetical protein
VNAFVILMIESEQPEGLSARKLVVETAQHNVLTAYNAEDGLGLLKRFPNVDVVMVHGAVLADHPSVVADVRAHAPDKPIILASPFADVNCPEADFFVDSHNPQDLLGVLEKDIPGWSNS